MPDLEVTDPQNGRRYTVEWLASDAPTAADVDAIIAEGRRRRAPKTVQAARKVQAKASNPLLQAFAKPKPEAPYKPRDLAEAFFGPPQPQVGDKPEVAKRHKAWQKEQLRKFDEPVRRGVAQIPSTQAEFDPFGRNEVYSEKMRGPAVAQKVLGGGRSVYHGLSMLQEGAGTAAGAAINAPAKTPLSTLMGDLILGAAPSTVKGMTPQASEEERQAALLNVLLAIGIPLAGKAFGAMASVRKAAGTLEEILQNAHPGVGDPRLVGRGASESVRRSLKALEGLDDSLVGLGDAPEAMGWTAPRKPAQARKPAAPLESPKPVEPPPAAKQGGKPIAIDRDKVMPDDPRLDPFGDEFDEPFYNAVRREFQNDDPVNLAKDIESYHEASAQASAIQAVHDETTIAGKPAVPSAGSVPESGPAPGPGTSASPGPAPTAVPPPTSRTPASKASADIPQPDVTPGSPFPTLARTEDFRKELNVPVGKTPRTVASMHETGDELLARRHPVEIANEVSAKRSANDAEQSALATATRQYQSDLRRLRAEHSAALNSGSDELKAAIPGMQAQIDRLESEAVAVLKAQADAAGSEVGRSLGLRAHLMPDTSSPQAARVWIESKAGMAVKDMPEPVRAKAEEAIALASDLENAAHDLGIYSADDLRARIAQIPQQARAARGGSPLERLARADKGPSGLKKHLSDVDRTIRMLEKKTAGSGVGKSKKRGAAMVVTPELLELAALRIYRGILTGVDAVADVAKSMNLDSRAVDIARRIAKEIESGAYGGFAKFKVRRDAEYPTAAGETPVEAFLRETKAQDLVRNVPKARKASIQSAMDSMQGYKLQGASLADHDEAAIEAVSKIVGGHMLAGERDADVLADIAKAYLNGLDDGAANAVVRMGVDDAFPRKAPAPKKPNLGDVRSATEKAAGASPDLKAREYRLKVEDAKRAQEAAAQAAKQAKEEAGKSVVQKAANSVYEILNAVPRALQASADVSALGRQAGKVAFKHPVIAAQNFVRSFPTLWSEGKYQALERRVQSSPRYFRALDAGMEFTGAGHGAVTAGEELFASRLAHSIPIWGKVVKGSDRAYTAMLDGVRMDVFEAVADNLEGSWSVIRDKAHPRHTPMTDAQAQILANFVNVATGRGDLGELKKVAGSLSMLFYSPRFAASNLEYMAGYPIWHRVAAKDGGELAARYVVLKEMSQNAAAIAGLSYLASLAGVKVSLDPTSSDFGKWRFGDTTVDVSGGLSSYITFAARQLKKTVEAQKGKRAGYKQDVAMSTAEFLRRKAAPSFSALIEGASGEQAFTRERTNLLQEFAGLFNVGSLGIRNALEQQNVDVSLWKDGRWSPSFGEIKPGKDVDRGRAAALTIADLLGFGTNQYTPKAGR